MTCGFANTIWLLLGYFPNYGALGYCGTARSGEDFNEACLSIPVVTLWA